MSDVEFVEYIVVIVVSSFFLAISIGYIIDCLADGIQEKRKKEKKERKMEMRSKDEIWRRAKEMMALSFFAGALSTLAIVYLLMQYGLFIINNAYK